MAEAAAPQAPPPSESSDVSPDSPSRRESAPKSSPKSTQGNAKKKGTKLRDRETEGTQALDRFEAETVIKSRYQHNGQSLEVDPD